MSDPQATIFERHLRDRAPDYFPELGQSNVEVVLTDRSERPGSRLYSFRVGNGVIQYPILVKVVRRTSEKTAVVPTSRPLLAQMFVEEKEWLEYRALTTIHDYFERLGDPRFGTIRILDALPDQHATIMMKLEDPNLLRLVVRRNRLLSLIPQDNLYDIFYNTGAWLRHYHQLPLEDYVTVRHATRADYEQQAEVMVKFLGDRLGDRYYFENVLSSLDTSVLPEHLPLGRGHGDFALRNVLVSSEHRVTMIDTQSRWQVPLYEDIGYFLIDLRTNQTQVITQGRTYSSTWIERCEKEFLQGYFLEENIPHQVIRLFKIQALLDRWTAVAERLTYRRSHQAKFWKTWKFQFSHRFYRKIIQDLLGRE